MRIAVFQYDAGMGGIQKSLRNLLTLGVLGEARVDVFLFREESFGDWQVETEQVHVHHLPALPRWYRFLPFSLVKKLCRAYRSWEGEYDLAVDFNSYQPDCALAALRCPAKKRVVWIHNDVQQVWEHEPKFRVLWHFMKDKFREFDEFVGVSDGVVKPFREMTGLKDVPIRVIPNCIDVAQIRELSEKGESIEFDPDRINLVTAGRLCFQKGFDLLLEIFAAVCGSRSDMELWILGDGEQRSELEAMSRRLGLEKRVHFVGAVSNPYRYMAGADAFVLCSRYEGQGMVLWEALAAGIPVLFPKHLEQYNSGLTGVDDLEQALLAFHRQEKHPEDLCSYHEEIRRRMESLLH